MTVFCYLVFMDKEIINFANINGVAVTDTTYVTEFPAHWHNAAEFTIVQKKGAKYKIGDNILEPSVGDILLVWPKELHEIIYLPLHGSMFIQFSSSLIENNTDLAAATGFLNKCHLISHRKNADLCRQITELIYELQDLYLSSTHFTETRCKMIVYNILLLIGEYVMEERREQIGMEKFSDKSWEYIRNALSFISQHASENISEALVAEAAGLSQYYFSKLFNEYTEMSFPDYLSGIRVQNAINLLINEKLSITECAFRAGFQSTTRFNKVFREITGTTPREYRKLHTRNHN